MESAEAPPPPPPLSPSRPLALEMTTIGKYIARFRYEKPQPREARAAAQRSDFWWTKSPRYSRSPSPPSTWASGGVFTFPDGDDEEELDAEITTTVGDPTKKEEEEEEEVLGAAESVDSVESKLRCRLGLSTSDLGLGISDKREELAAEKSSKEEVLQSWGSTQWGAIELDEQLEFDDDEEEEDREDPEEVIERVRKRLGWEMTSGASSRLKPIEFRLSMDGESDRRRETATGQRQRRWKPPLSPGPYTHKETLSNFGRRSGSSWASMGRERGDIDEHIEEVESSIDGADAKDNREQVSMMEEKELPVAEMEDTISVRVEHMSLVKGSNTKSVLSASGLQPSISSVGPHSSQRFEPCEGPNGTSTTPVNESVDDVLSCKSESKLTVEEKEDKMQSQGETQHHEVADHVSELPLLSTASPVRPESAQELDLSAPNGNLSARSHDLNSPSRKVEGLAPPDTAKTLDNLVSLVVHSWGNDIISDSGGKEKEAAPADEKQQHGTENRQDSIGTGGVSSATNTAASSIANDLTSSKDSSAHGETVCDKPGLTTPMLTAEESSVATISEEIVYESINDSTQLVHEGEEEEDSEAPGEEEDQIVQMLLGRIALLEEALRQMDS